MGLTFENRTDFSGVRASIAEKTPVALAQAMEVIRAASVPLVPVETGRLAGAASVTVEGKTASLYYPGPYARYQEFGVYYRHGRFGLPLKHLAGGQAFFLSNPMRFAAPDAIDTLAAALFA